MSKTIAAAGINGAYTIVDEAKVKFDAAREKHGGAQKVGFPNTGYYLPCIYAMLGHKVETLDDMAPVIEECDRLLPHRVQAQHHLPYLGPALDAGMAGLFAEELSECIRYLEDPDFYVQGETPDLANGKVWLGAADDVILRKRGVEFVDGSAPGFAAILGAAPNPQIAADIARELQEKNLYVFMAGTHNGVTFSEQLVEAGVEIGWGTRLVSFSPDCAGACFALGFATRAAMSFGGVEPGNYRENLIYNKDRVFAFAITLGTVTERWYANGLACVNYGFPIIADTKIPEILPTGVCTYEHVVSNIPVAEIAAKATEVRGLKVTVAKVPVPVSYGPAFEGERIRGEEIYMEGGGGRTLGVELTRMLPMDAVEDGKVTVDGPELADIEPGSRLPIGIKVEVAGRQMQEDFEPILERQIHHLLNYAQGLMHIGQRDIAWFRIGKSAVKKGLKLEDFGKIIHAKYHQDFGEILDKVQVTVFSEKEKVQALLDEARAAYTVRDERVEGMADEDTETFYSCTLCQSFAPNHVCVVTPERTGLCGAYSWLDCKASFEINPTGPNQPIEKGAVIDPVKGQWEGTNEFVYKASRGNVPAYNAYSIMEDPMTSCGCFEAIAALLPMCNGFMTVDRDYSGMTPSGMKFTTLAGSVGGGEITPGFVGHSKLYVISRKFVSADGGLKRLVWMPKRLKDELREKLIRRGEEIGMPDFVDRIADETNGTTEDEILEFLTAKEHPALTMDPLF